MCRTWRVTSIFEWIRNRRKQSKPKNLPYKIGYVRRLPDEAVSLVVVADRMIKGPPFPRRGNVSAAVELDEAASALPR